MPNADARELLFSMLEPITGQLSTVLSPPAVTRVLASLFAELDQAFVPLERRAVHRQRLADNARWLGLVSEPFDATRFARKHVMLQLHRQAEEAVCVFTPVERQVAWASQSARITGLSHAMRIAKSGRGAVVVSAHLGPMVYYGPALTFFMAMECTPPDMVIVANPPSNERVERQLEEFGRLHGSRLRYVVKPLDGADAFRALLDEELAAGTWVLTQVDVLSGGRSSRTVEMFGRSLRMPGIRGAARLAARHGVPVLPVVASRTVAGGVKVRVEPPMTPESDDGSRLAQQIALHIEAWVRRTPADWGLLPKVHKLAS